MSDASPPPFSFAQFVPGFDFLRNLAAGGAATASAVPGLGSMSSWVAPTLSVEEIDKRIQELKAVQYWLEQNGHALKATIQALEVQRMTLSTLRGMNVRMEDLAQAFADSTTRAAEAVRDAAAAATAAPTSRDEAGASEPAPEPAADAPAAEQADAPAAAPGVIDPLQWWGSLTQQFQQIASHAIKEASAMQMPMAAGTMPEASAAAATPAGRKAPAKKAASRKTAARKKPAASKSSAGKKPAAASAARRTGGNRSTG